MLTRMKKITIAAACAAACAVSCSGAFADGMMDAMMPEHAPNVIGMALGSVPDYLGSNHNTVGVAPMARYQFKDSDRYVLIMANELDVNLLNNSSWRAGPVLNYSFGRKDVKDDVVDRMHTLDGIPGIRGLRSIPICRRAKPA